MPGAAPCANWQEAEFQRARRLLGSSGGGALGEAGRGSAKFGRGFGEGEEAGEGAGEGTEVRGGGEGADDT